MSTLHSWSVLRLLRRRDQLAADLQETPQHLYPLLHASTLQLSKEVNDELSKRADQPARRVALRRHYDEHARLEDELDELDSHGRYGF